MNHGEKDRVIIESLKSKEEFVKKTIYDDRNYYSTSKLHQEASCHKVTNGNQFIAIINGTDEFCGIQLVQNKKLNKNLKLVKEYFVVIGDKVVTLNNEDTEQVFNNVIYLKQAKESCRNVPKEHLGLIKLIDFEETIKISMHQLISSELISMNDEEINKAISGEYNTSIVKEENKKLHLFMKRNEEINLARETVEDPFLNFIRPTKYGNDIRKCNENIERLKINIKYYEQVQKNKNQEKEVEQKLKVNKEQEIEKDMGI